MAETLSDDARVHACFEQQRRGRVAQVVEADRREARAVRECSEDV